MSVHFSYPSLVEVARKFGFRLGTGMHAITPLEDDERGFNGPDGAQIVLNRKNCKWEYSDADGKFVRYGNSVLTLQELLTRRYDHEE